MLDPRLVEVFCYNVHTIESVINTRPHHKLQPHPIAIARQRHGSLVCSLACGSCRDALMVADLPIGRLRRPLPVLCMTNALGLGRGGMMLKSVRLADGALNEAAAREYFLESLPGEAHGCPKCGEARTYGLKDGRSRCARCGYTFHAFSLRWINRGGLAFSHWMTLVALFAEGVPAQRIAQRMHLTYNTVHKALTTLRLAVWRQIRWMPRTSSTKRTRWGSFAPGAGSVRPRALRRVHLARVLHPRRGRQGGHSCGPGPSGQGGHGLPVA